jgi:hypothetical protein
LLLNLRPYCDEADTALLREVEMIDQTRFLPAGSAAAATTATTAAATAAAATSPATTTGPPAPAAVTTTAAAATRRFGTSFVDIHGPAIQVRAVQFRYCRFRIPAFSHLDESEATGLTGFPIGYDVDAFDAAKCRKGSVKILLRSLIAEVPHKNIRHRLSPLMKLVFVLALLLEPNSNDWGLLKEGTRDCDGCGQRQYQCISFSGTTSVVDDNRID